MNVAELYMTLEVYAHLRDLPQYAALKTEIEKKLREENEALIPKPQPVEEPVQGKAQAKYTPDAIVRPRVGAGEEGMD